MKWLQFKSRARCPHIRIRGIYGDEIQLAPRFSRLQCVSCGKFLDGPVSYATHVRINAGLFSADSYAPKDQGIA